MLGSLDQRAALEALTLTPDCGGGYSDAWQTFAVVWVSLHPVAANDAFGPDTAESRARYRILLRRRADVAPGQRVVIGARCFAVRAILDEGPRAPLMTLLCEDVP
ncbi:MAG: head-tail adaptor protein [Alphaproteobacteria bacterium]|nr:head-tail adaptor protein [Alphaproteobacteria bacterium]